MINKLPLCLGTAVLTVSLAGTAHAREGAYLGAQVGWADTGIKITDRQYGNTFDGLHGEGVNGTLFAGIGRRGANGFLALEINGGMGNAEAELRGVGTTAYRIQESYGVGFLAGMNSVGDSALFVRAGWQRASFKAEDKGPGYSWNEERDHDGLRAGVGVLLPISHNVDFRAEWNKTFYGKKDYDHGAISIKPTETQFALGVSYRF